ncbi:MAG: excalibur calcium-binding domain-containing protein [Candidatus Sericytochromatia bacterium]|nr:excalibur calcium-binding domain-containing protein [Candidatus Sericytochromatia bacterium]
MLIQFLPLLRNLTLLVLPGLFCLNLSLSACSGPSESTSLSSLGAFTPPQTDHTPSPQVIASTQPTPSFSPSLQPSASAVPSQLSTPSPSQPSPTIPLSTPSPTPSAKPSPTSTLPIATPTPLGESPYRCEGKEYCSQMTSCQEALFYLKNCPNPKTDGDNDGIPCESQWCGSKQN